MKDCMASILRHAKARPETIQIAKKLVCSVCLQHKRVDGARKGAPPRNLSPNQIVDVDTVWLPGDNQSIKKNGLELCLLAHSFSVDDFTSGLVFLDPLKEFIVILVRNSRRFSRKWLSNMILFWILVLLKLQHRERSPREREKRLRKSCQKP